MIIIRLWGGLGNQMFQYCYGYSVAKRNKTNLILDTSFYTEEFLSANPRFTKQKLKITDYPLDYPKTINIGEPISPLPFLQRKTINRIIRIPKHFSIRCGNGYRYIKETRYKYSEHLNTLAGNKLYLDGYWQSPKYFEIYREDLIRQFSLKSCEWETELKHIIDEMESTNSIAVHIRHGDYSIEPKWYTNLVMLDKVYYSRAIKQVIEELECPRFYFFTDDPEWVRNEFGPLKNSTIVSGSIKCTDIQELILMSKCKHQIIANSTFSWWAAWINQHNGKKIWAPAKGWGNRDIIPQGWKIVDITQRR